MIIDALDTRDDRPGLMGLPRYHVINDPQISEGLRNLDRKRIEAAMDDRQPIYINYEQTRLNMYSDGEASVEAQTDLIVSYIRQIRGEYPGVRLSLWNRPDMLHPRLHMVEQWPQIAGRLGKARDEDGTYEGVGVNDVQDFFTPGRYLPLSWANYHRRLEVWSEATLYAIRWCRSQNKLCYPFISQAADGMPQWMVRHLYSDDDMLYMCRFCLQHADGIYLWGGYTQGQDGKPTWLARLLDAAS